MLGSWLQSVHERNLPIRVKVRSGNVPVSSHMCLSLLDENGDRVIMTLGEQRDDRMVNLLVRPLVLMISLVATNDSCKLIFSLSSVESFYVLHILPHLLPLSLHFYNTSYIRHNTSVLSTSLCTRVLCVYYCQL